MARLVLVCLASIVVVAFAGPVQQQHGGHQKRNGTPSSDSLRPLDKCDQRDNIFKSGNTYEYKYFGKAETGLGFGDSKTVGLALECQVRLTVPQPCEYHMKVSSCEVFEHDGSEDDDQDQDGHPTLEDEVRHLETKEISRRGFQRSDRSQEMERMVSRHIIQAQIADGQVARVIYHDDEEMWVVNFKKAILDALQVDAGLQQSGRRDRLTMVSGIHGLCPTKFSEKSTPQNIIVEKDLDACIHAKKNNWNLSPLTPVWNMSLVAKVMRAESVCSYKLEQSSHIRAMTCRETHHLLALPWTKLAAATANVTQTLRFVRKESNADQMDRNLDTKTITSILYEHENATDVDRKPGQGKADDILKDLVQKATDGFDIDAPATFDQFVDELRDSENLEDVLAVARSMRHNEAEVAKYLLVQGLVQCNAPACLRALTTLMQADEIPRAVFEPVVMALALTKQQDPLFLDEVKRICEARPTRMCALMVGALAHKLVEDDEDILEDRESAQPIEQAAQFLMDLIEEGKCEPSNKLDKADEDSDATKLIIALKAIGNLGHVAQKVQTSRRSPSSSRIEDKIAKCMTDPSTPDNVTIAAIHAVRRFVPSQQISDQLLAVLANQDESPEVRMAACMASVRMASEKTAVRNIVKVMEKEKSDQVKAFMVSHLRTVLKSDDPNYKKVAEHLMEVLQEQGQSELPKIKARIPHSLHIELSKFYKVPFLDDEENEFGAQIESMAMFSTKSYLPKSLQLNVSTQVFGDYINLIETGVDMQGVEHLVEKVLGPQGIISKSKYLKKAKETISKILQVIEELGYKHLRLEDAKEFARKVVELIQSKEYGGMIDQVLTVLQDVDTSALTQIFSHIRAMDVEKIKETIRRSIPQSAQFNKTMEKLKRIRFQDASKETLVEVLEAFGITAEKSRQIISQAEQYGVNVDQIVAWIKRTDFEEIQKHLKNLRLDDMQQKLQTIVKKVEQLLKWLAEKYNLPSPQAMMEMVKEAFKNPSQIKQLAESFLESRRIGSRKEAGQDREDEDEDDESEDEDEADNQREKNDHSSLDKMPWGAHVKTFKRGQRDEDREGKKDDEDVDITAFLRLFGDEIGFISLSDITKMLNMKVLKKTFDLSKGRLADILDGFDVQPTLAAKMEGVHHIATGLGLPLQITVNVTGIATLHMKVQPQGSLKQSAVEFEPSGALQIAGGMSIDLPSIHSIAVVSNTTVKSEFEFKMRLDIKHNSIELDIAKPDEELDIFHIRHEVKLVKDDEDFAPFDNAKSHEVKTQKCLPEVVERITGLKICSELESSTLKGTPMLSHGPHELRVSIQESQNSGLQHIKLAGKHSQQDTENRFEFNLRAPGHQLPREARAILIHDRRRNHVQMNVDLARESTPRARFFLRNLADSDIKFGYETGVDIEMANDKHYNASAIVIAKIKGYGYGSIVDMIKDAEFNYTLGASVQAPLVALNVTTTTAKIAGAFFMEHNLTYVISEEIRIAAMQKLRFPGADQRGDASKFTLRHGVRVKSDQIAHDVQAFIQLLTFPLLGVAEPTIQHISQIKVHRDYRHIGLHSNTTWLNEQDEVEFFNASATANNIVDIVRLKEERAVSLNFNVSRNDWHVVLENEIEKKGNGITITNELSAFGMIPECRGFVDCALKRLKADLKTVASIRKFKVISDRHHGRRQHKIRDARSQDDSTTFRQQELTVTVEHELKEKTKSTNDNGFWNQRTSQVDQKVYQVKTNIEVRGTNDAKAAEVTAMTIFGADANQRDAVVSYYLVLNASATNIPFTFDHFSHVVVTKEAQFAATMYSGISRNDETYAANNGHLTVDLKNLKAGAGLMMTTPFLTGTAEFGVKKSGKAQIELKMLTMAKSETPMMEALAHELTATTKLAVDKMSQSLRFRHAKLESDLKLDFDLYGGRDSGFEEGDEDEMDSETRGARHNGSAGAGFLQQKKDKSETAPNQRRSPRDVSRRSDRRQDADRETDTDNEQEIGSWSQQHGSRNGVSGQRTSAHRRSTTTTDRSDRQRHNGKESRRAGQDRQQESSSTRRTFDRDEDYETNEVQIGRTKHTFGSLKKAFATINPTVSSSIRINSLDHELLPSLNVETKLSIGQVKMDVEIRQVPRSMEHILSARHFTVQGEIEKQKAFIKLIMAGRGEAGAEVVLHNERIADAKVYDRDLLKSGETVHVQVTLELPTESNIRAKIFVNPESGPKIARAVTQTAKATLQASTRFFKERSDAVLKEARLFWSDQRNPLVSIVLQFFGLKGSLEEVQKDWTKSLKEWKETMTESMYGDESLFGTSLKELVKMANEQRKKWMKVILQLIENTPAGALVEAMPSFTELAQKVSKVANKNFAPQMHILKSRQSCLTLQSCDPIAALRSVQEVAIELAQSIDKVKAREMADKALQTIKDLLLDGIKAVKELAKQNPAWKNFVDSVDIKALETAIREADIQTLDSVLEAARLFEVLAKSLVGEKVKSILHKEGDKVVLTVPHPFRWNSFKELPKLSEGHLRSAQQYFEQTKRTFRDIYDDDNVHIPIAGRNEGLRFRWSDVKNLQKKNLPTQTAMIFGDRQIMTFDGKVYSIPQSDKQCTYLMVRGSKKENFALVKSHDGITLTVPEMSITINHQNEVRLNNSRTVVDLPVESANKQTTVKLVGDTVEIESETGITVKFNGDKKVVVVEVSSGMWDEAMGLLGTNDNEADNDWRMPSGKHATHAEEFVNAFEVSKKSQCQLVRPGQNRRAAGDRQCKESSKCAAFFRNDDSDLSECFQTVEPNEFLSVCEEETKQCNQTITEDVVCAIVGAYREICSIKGVETEAPEECATCDGRKENSKWNIRGNQRKVDVVVVVSEHQDLAKDHQSPAEKIRTLMETITRKLQQHNGQDVRAALVGFSGAGVHKDGHTHTVDKKQFDSINKLPRALKTLEFEGRQQTDVLETIDFVVESHDFRPEATKIILVFGPEERQFVSGGRHQSVQEKLIERGITVTVFAKYEELKERDLGVNFDGTILSSKSKFEDTRGDMPSRRMSRVAKATRGAIFKLEAVLGGQRDAEKKSQAEERTAETILEQIKREENLCKTCTCQQTDFNQLISSCKVAACA